MTRADAAWPTVMGEVPFAGLGLVAADLWVTNAFGNSPTATRLLGVEFDERGVRLGMERCYRTLARDASDMWERIALVQSANTIRPRTRI